jgi:hypothetical protein
MCSFVVAAPAVPDLKSGENVTLHPEFNEFWKDVFQRSLNALKAFEFYTAEDLSMELHFVEYHETGYSVLRVDCYEDHGCNEVADLENCDDRADAEFEALEASGVDPDTYYSTLSSAAGDFNECTDPDCDVYEDVEDEDEDDWYGNDDADTVFDGEDDDEKPLAASTRNESFYKESYYDCD